MINKVNKGLTLLEIVISIAILGILAVSFLPLFNVGFSGISAAGNRSKATYITQMKIEEELYGTGSTAGVDKLAIRFLDNASDKIEVQGKIGTENTVYNGKTVNITFFKPNR